MKKTILFLLTVVLCFVMLGTLPGRGTKADDSFKHNGEGWGITADGTLVVDIENGDFKKNGIVPEWYSYKDQIYKAEVSLGSPTNLSRMFTGLTNLTSVTFHKCNTSNVKNMSRMFYDCSSLTSLDLSGLDTSNVEEMTEMFYGCSSLTSLNLSKFNTSKVETMSGMFYDCKKLTSLDLSSFVTSNVTTMSSMFVECSSLTSLDLSNFDTSSVITMWSMFGWCSSLTSLNLSSFNTSKVTNMGQMFYECNNLTSLNLSGFNTSNVKDMSSMFCNCRSLTSLNLNNFDTSKVTDMKEMFKKCTMQTLDISSFDTSNCRDMLGMFRYCYDLSSITFGNKFDTSNVRDMSYMFASSGNLQTFSVKIPFHTQNVTDMQSIFSGCRKLSDSALENIGFKDFDTSNVKIFGAMFQNCVNLSVIDLSNWNFSKATTPISFDSELQVHTIIIPANMPSEIKLPASSKNPRKWYSTYNPTAVYTETCANINTAITYISILTPKLDKTTLTLTDTNKTEKLTTTVSPLNITDTHVIYESSDPAIATVDNTGKVTAVSNGSCEITVTADDINKSSDTCSVTVHVYEWSAGGEDHLHEWSADWDKDGMGHWHNCTVTSPACNITENNQKDGYAVHEYDDESDMLCNVCGYCRMESISLNESSVKLTGIGDTATLMAIAQPLGTTLSNVTYSSSDENIATVDENGRVTAVSNGSCTITVTSNDVPSCSATCNIDVHVHSWSEKWEKNGTHHWHNCTITSPDCNITENNQKGGYAVHEYDDESDMLCNICGYCRMESISLNESSVKLTGIGDTATLTAIAQPLGTTISNVTYSSSDESIATVDKNGKVTAVSNGSCTITVTSNDVPSCFATCNIEVYIPGSSATDNAEVHNPGSSATDNAEVHIPGSSATDNVAAHVHSWSEKWENDETHHWHNCENSGCAITADSEKYAYGVHFYDDVLDQTCNDCGYVRKIVVKDEKGTSGNDLANRTDLPILLVTGSCYKNKNVKLTWTKYASASGYEVYWSYCDGRSNYSLLGSVKKTQYIHKKLKKNREYKYFVIAYKKVGKKKVYLCKSPFIHVAMSYDKCTNVKKIKTNETDLTLKKEETFQIKAKLTKQNKSKPLIKHVSKVRYYTTNKEVATVSKTGKITAKNIGQCTIYVAANSGLTKKIVVKVQ